VSCTEIRESVSSLLDGEAPPLPAAVVDRHLELCDDCRAWADAARLFHREVRVRRAPEEPDRTAAILGGLGRRRTRRDERVRVLQVITLLTAAVQVGTSLPLLLAGQGLDGDLERHVGVFAVAMAAGLVLAGLRPGRARAMVPVLAVLVAGLAWTCLGDLIAGRAVPEGALAHVADLAGLAVVWLLARATDGFTEAPRRVVVTR